MYRFLLTPRWWAINVFVLLSIPFCLFMGSWQLGRFEDRVDTHQARQERSEARSGDRARPAARPLEELLPLTEETVGERARATGRYDTGREFLVPGRRIDDREGFYVLTMLRTGDGPALPVVRGWLPGAADPARVPAPPGGEVTVTGAVQAPETQSSRGVSAGGALPDGQLGIISAATLVNMVPYEVRDVWITVERPREPMAAVPPVAPAGAGLDLKAFQNLGYTAQWFVFAGFVIFMWYRLFRREAETAHDLALGLPPEPGPGSEPEPGPGGDSAPGPGDEVLARLDGRTPPGP
ncbi:SURF1 family protein [Streptomyces sp. TRM 70361]|uniref:SURF1 family protein n=1 Tax=Streptomyces sp. TRM 70361 TaxID=3116553 RepID=UPI002E7B518B|nr:SURF1 family protein [Streptomyces sp. TRM 70361]MEE1941482.1 SURF1 family protein [Streptomyces sp. TRM 70361]